jgi:DNA repair exonuclease SbcCD nuclease subunit
MRPLRIVHTSDVHLDTSFAASCLPSALGTKKREAIRATFRRILEDARAAEVDLVLVPGDLFDHERVTADTVAFLKRQFEQVSPIRVFIAPGNHDPYVHGSPYHEASWPANVHIFRDEEWRAVELLDLGVRVTGFAFNRSALRDRHFARLPVLSADAVNVVVAHGSDLGRAPVGKSQHGPFEIGEIARKNVTYCALGHYHEQRRLENPWDGTEVWYSGIPEGRGFEEPGELAYLRVEIADGRAAVERIGCNHIPLCDLVLDCDGFSTREQVLDALLARRGLDFGALSIVRVRLTGAVDPSLELAAPELEDRLEGAALHFQWDDRTVPAVDLGSFAGQSTLSGRFVRLFDERLADAGLDPAEREKLERARLYGVQALLGYEVHPR